MGVPGVPRVLGCNRVRSPVVPNPHQTALKRARDSAGLTLEESHPSRPTSPTVHSAVGSLWNEPLGRVSALRAIEPTPFEEPRDPTKHPEIIRRMCGALPRGKLGARSGPSGQLLAKCSCCHGLSELKASPHAETPHYELIVRGCQRAGRIFGQASCIARCRGVMGGPLLGRAHLHELGHEPGSRTTFELTHSRDTAAVASVIRGLDYPSAASSVP